MSITNLLKGLIDSLPDEQFTQAWECIEEIEAALAKSGDTGLLALKFVMERQQEAIGLLIVAQAALVNLQAERLVDLEKGYEELTDMSEDMYKDLRKANKKLAKQKSKK